MSDLEIKAAVRERDGHRCTECGMDHLMHLVTYGQNLDVHRITPGSKYTIDGCVTLCKSCHMRKPKSPRGTIRIRKLQITDPHASLVRQVAKKLRRKYVSVVCEALEQYLEAQED